MELTTENLGCEARELPEWYVERYGLEPASWGDFNTVREHDVPPERIWYTPDETSGSDYSGGLYHRANANAVMAIVEACECPDCTATPARIVEISGGHGTFAVAIRSDVVCTEVLGAYAAMADYPVLDGDEHSRLEMEAQDDAWKSWAEADFARALERRFSVEIDTDKTRDAAAGEWTDFAGLFYAAADRAGEYWANTQGPNMWIDVERVAAAVDRDEIASFVAE